MTDDERPGADPDPSWDPAERFDDEDDDDYLPLRRRSNEGSNTALTIGVALVLLVIVAAIVITTSRKKDDNAAPTTTLVAPGPGAGPTASAPAQPLCGNWPENWGFENTQLEAGTAGPGVYIWSGFDGWHLRLVAGPGIERVTGTLSIESTDLKLVAVGTATAQVEANRATFSVDGGNGQAGFDANISCNTRALLIQVDGPDGPVAIDKLFIGRTSKSLANPVSAQRQTV